MKIKANLSAGNIIEWLFSILLILEVNSVFFKSYNFNFYISELACVCVLALIIINKVRVNKRILIFLLIYEFFALFYLFILVNTYADGMVSYSVKFIIFLPIMVVYYGTNENRGVSLIIKMANCVVILAAASLVAYFVSYIVSPFGYFTVDWGGVNNYGNYIFFFLGQKQEIAGQHFVRNIGVFCEAPMYAFVLSMAFCTQLFFYPKPSKVKIVILIITILSTLSASGIAVMAGLLVLKYYLGDLTGLEYGSGKICKIKKKGFLKYVLGVIGIVAAAVVVYDLYKFKVSTGNSYRIRVDDYVAAFKAWLSNPIFGVGYDNSAAIIQYMADWRIKRYSNQGFSNAVSHILATMGIFGAGTYILGFFYGIKGSIKKKKSYAAVQFMVLLALMSVTVVPMQLSVLQYVALGLAVMCQTSHKRTVVNI